MNSVLHIFAVVFVLTISECGSLLNYIDRQQDHVVYKLSRLELFFQERSKEELPLLLRHLKDKYPSGIPLFSSSEAPDWFYEDERITGGGVRDFETSEEWRQGWKKTSVVYFTNPFVVGQKWDKRIEIPVLLAFDRYRRVYLYGLDINGKPVDQSYLTPINEKGLH